MQHTLHLISVSGPDKLAHVRAVREALRSLSGGDATAMDADNAIREAGEAGYCLLGTSESRELLVQLQDALDDAGCQALVNYDADEPETQPSPEEALGNPPAEPNFSLAPDAPDSEGAAVSDATSERPERPYFSDAAYETAMALLVANDGNPLHAASSGFTLGRSTQDAELYAETINAIIYVFPHVGEILRANGLTDG